MQVEFSGNVGANLDPCAALSVNYELKADEEKEIVFLLGAGRSVERGETLVTKYRVEEIKSLKVKSFGKKSLEECSFIP